MAEHRVNPGQYGFSWGPMNVTRVADARGYVVLDITTATGKSITVYVSPTGRSLRVYGEGSEWKPGEPDREAL